MKKKVLLVHSAGKQGPHEGSDQLVKSLQDALKPLFEVTCPMMPAPENPRYLPWKEQLASAIVEFGNQEIALIGHSLGGSVLLKFLSEEPCLPPISGIFLVAAAYWGKKGWEIEEFMLNPDFDLRLPDCPVYLYHSREDKWVPFSHLVQYSKKITKACVRALEGDQHEFAFGLPQLVADIQQLAYGRSI